MALFGSQIMDFWGMGPKRVNSDDTFLDIIRATPDLLKEAFLNNCVICCPVSASIGNDAIPKEQLLSHILVPGRTPGEFISLSGQHVHISGNYLVCGTGYKEARKVKIVNVGQISDMWGKIISTYYIHRPLVGGLHAPEEVDEMSSSLMLKYVSTMKSNSDVRAAFVALDEYLRELKVLGRMSSLDGFQQITPSLSAALRTQWVRTCERIARTDALTANLGGGDAEKAREYIEQIVESYIMLALVEFVYPFVCRKVDIGETSIQGLMEGIHLCTQSDLGVAPEFQTNQSEAIRELVSVAEAPTPVEKMQVFTRVINHIREAIDVVVTKKFPSAEVEFATDDLVCVLIWVILQAYPHYRLIVVDLQYCREFHFCNSSRTQLGYNLCHLEVAVSWFTRRAAAAQRVVQPPSAPSPIPGLAVENSDGELSGHSHSKVNQAMGPSQSSESVPGDNSLTLKLISESAAASEEQQLGDETWPTLLVVDNLRDNIRWAQHHSDWDINTPLGRSLFDSKESLTEEIGVSGERAAVATAEPASMDSADKTFGERYPQHMHGRHFVVLNVYSRTNRAVDVHHILSEETNKPDTIAATTGYADYFAALTSSGVPYTWGPPDCGRLGRGVTAELDFFMAVRSPSPVPGLSSYGRMRQLACGKGHMLAVNEAGDMFVWGDNRCGQLGLFDLSVKASDKANRNSGSKMSAVAELAVSSELAMVKATGPTLLEAMTHVRVVSVAAGAHHSLCLGSDGLVYSWGRAANGRLGQHSEKQQSAEHMMGRPGPVRCKWQPTATFTLEELAVLRPSWADSSSSVAKGLAHSGSANNLHRASSPPSTVRSMSPGVVPSAAATSKVVFITAGFNYSLAVTACGAVYTWGCGTYGALGHGSHCDEYLPRLVMSLRFAGASVVSASASHHTLFLTASGLVFGCGLNNRQQVGSLGEVSARLSTSRIDRDSVLVARPVEIPAILGRTFSDGLTEVEGGGGGGSSLPTPLAMSLVKSVSCGEYHSAVMTTDQRIVMWGDGELRGPEGSSSSSGGGQHPPHQPGAKRDITHLISMEKQVKQVVSSGETITVLVD